MTPEVSIVVPVYRSAQTLASLCERIGIAIEPLDPHYEILLVEDCGEDDSWEEIERLSTANIHLRGFQLSRNFGQHAATLCGISHTKGKWVATLDDDLEQLPEYLPQLYAKAYEGYDLVYGIYPERTHKAWRNLTSNLARWLFRKAIPSLNQAYTSYRFIRGDIARNLTQFDSPFPFIDGYLSWLTNRYATVEVAHGNRLQGASNYTFRKLFSHTINVFVTFSDLPLKLSTWIGLIFSMIGMLWLVVILFGKISGIITVSGYPSLIAAIALFGGIQLLILGILGEYLGRMNFKSSRKPLYLVGRTTNYKNMSDAK